jgi:hypothetical protein
MEKSANNVVLSKIAAVAVTSECTLSMFFFLLIIDNLPTNITNVSPI